jgi:hypothetical protein
VRLKPVLGELVSCVCLFLQSQWNQSSETDVLHTGSTELVQIWWHTLITFCRYFLNIRLSSDEIFQSIWNWNYKESRRLRKTHHLLSDLLTVYSHIDLYVIYLRTLRPLLGFCRVTEAFIDMSVYVTKLCHLLGFGGIEVLVMWKQQWHIVHFCTQFCQEELKSFFVSVCWISAFVITSTPVCLWRLCFLWF